MLQDHCESLIQVEYLAVCQALCWALEMQAVSRLCTGTLSLLPSSLSILFRLLERKDCRLSGLNSSSSSQFWRLEVQDQSVSVVGLVGLSRWFAYSHFPAVSSPPFHPLVSEVPCLTVGHLSSGSFQRPSLLTHESGATQTCSPQYRSGRTSQHCPSGLSFLPSAFSPCFLDPGSSFQTYPLVLGGHIH